MRCVGCRAETLDTVWGDWCDACGGVMVPGNPPKLFFRHVATVSLEKSIYPIVYDLSSESYGVAWPKTIITVQCIHCGQHTPVDDKHGLNRLDDLALRRYNSKRGSLDAIIAFIQPIVQDGSPEMPSLAPAFSATEEEIKIIKMGA